MLSFVQIMSSEKGPVVAPMITTGVAQARQVNNFHNNKICNYVTRLSELNCINVRLCFH